MKAFERYTLVAAGITCVSGIRATTSHVPVDQLTISARINAALAADIILERRKTC